MFSVGCIVGMCLGLFFVDRVQHLPVLEECLPYELGGAPLFVLRAYLNRFNDTLSHG